MNARRDPDRLIHTFVLEGEEELQDQVYDAVRARIERKRQRAFIGPWRTPIMNRIVGFGLAGRGRGRRCTHRFSAPRLAHRRRPGFRVHAVALADRRAHPRGDSGIVDLVWYPRRLVRHHEHRCPGADHRQHRLVRLVSTGGTRCTFEGRRQPLDPPETVGAALLAWAWPAGTGFYPYGDPCQWSTTIPETPATTPDEIAAAFAAQASTDATEPVGTSSPVAGPGKSVTLTVPIRFDAPNATRRKNSPIVTTPPSASTGPTANPDLCGTPREQAEIDELGSWT